MKIIHTADWHLGKFLNEFSLIEDQSYFLNKLIEYIKAEKADVLIIAGDVYQRAVPHPEAIKLLDKTLTCIIDELHIPIMIVSGNHDGAIRLSAYSKILKQKGLYICTEITDKPYKVTLTDNFGNVNFYLVPYFDPIDLRVKFNNDCIKSQSDAFDAVADIIENDMNKNERNILIAHGFFAAAKNVLPKISESETSVGGSDLIVTSRLSMFDYTALGHIHSPQEVGLNNARYSGSLLKYSVSEADSKKSVTCIDLGEKGSIDISEKTILPLRDLRVITTSFDEIKNNKINDNATDDYVFIKLTDQERVMDVMAKIRDIYKNAVGISYINEKDDSLISTEKLESLAKKSTLDMFLSFNSDLGNDELSKERTKLITDIIKQAERGDLQ